ncbi:hypothetical protein LXA43DRAFT_1033189 [Ganoderma leucocontextum]|nr:hypothetical protein LXA43DRAFT_1033189 [Ganoderma leucocontextum]
MSREQLPFDVLLLILEVAPRRTMAKMTQTCYALRDGGARFLLGGGVSLATGNSIISFVRFLRVDAVSRFQYLRVLEIARGELPPRTVDALLWLILHPLLALDSLTLREADMMLTSTPSFLEPIHGVDRPLLLTALAGLTTLRHLTVDQCDQRACSLIRTIRSPLKTISIDFISIPDREEVENWNPIVLLTNHSKTLEEISGSNFAMRRRDHEWPVVYDVAYRLVRTINATYDIIHYPRTVEYLAAFPNLTHLSLTAAAADSSGWRVNTFCPVHFSLALRRRSWNKNHQETQTPRLTWRNLEEVEGNVTDILALGLACHVPKLRLLGTILLKSLEYEHLATVLEDTRPASLAITVSDASTFVDRMGNVLKDPSAQQLRALEVELVFGPSEGDMDIQTVLNDVATTLALLPLHHLTLTINYGLLTAPDESHRPRYGWSCPVERDVEGLDLVETRTLFRAAIPSLATDVVVHLSTDRTGYEARLNSVAEWGV